MNDELGWSKSKFSHVWRAISHFSFNASCEKSNISARCPEGGNAICFLLRHCRHHWIPGVNSKVETPKINQTMGWFITMRQNYNGIINMFILDQSISCWHPQNCFHSLSISLSLMSRCKLSHNEITLETNSFPLIPDANREPFPFIIDISIGYGSKKKLMKSSWHSPYYQPSWPLLISLDPSNCGLLFSGWTVSGWNRLPSQN